MELNCRYVEYHKALNNFNFSQFTFIKTLDSVPSPKSELLKHCTKSPIPRPLIYS